MVYSTRCPGCVRQTQTLGRVVDQRNELRAAVARLTKERDDYKKAKAENDERFMLERDGARAQVAKLEDAVVELLGLLDDIVSGDYKPDSFTGQPLLCALSEKARAKYEAQKAAKALPGAGEP